MPPRVGDYVILNLGCGTKPGRGCINVDWSFHLRFKRLPFSAFLAPYVFRGNRLNEYRKLGDDIVVRDLRRGIPYPDQSVNTVYHSHFLEHIDRPDVPHFLAEVRRVLKPGGIHRIVVPDLEKAARLYLRQLDACRAGITTDHDEDISTLILQMVQKESNDTALSRPGRRWIENKILGDARKRGQTHQWMYDEVNLRETLNRTGFTDIQVLSYDRSAIPGWEETGLDREETGREYKPESLYVEATPT